MASEVVSEPKVATKAKCDHGCGGEGKGSRKVLLHLCLVGWLYSHLNRKYRRSLMGLGAGVAGS